MLSPSAVRPSPDVVRRLAPGLAATAAAVVVAALLHLLVPPLAMLTAAVTLGVLAANLRLLPAAAKPGTDFAARKLLRAGIVLLGLQLAVSEVLALGWATLLIVVAVVFLTFVGTRWLGGLLGLAPGQSLLVAAGFSICGASAIAAVDGVKKNDREDVATAVALVTICGTLAIAVLPLLQHPLGLTDEQFGRWVGASVHDVAQVVATAGVAGAVALEAAVVVKLIRVVMLAPMVAVTAMLARREGQQAGKRPALLPGFVVAFLATIAIRSTGLVPTGTLDAAQTVQSVLLAAALFGLGAGVHLPTLLRTGTRAALLGLSSWILIGLASLGGILLTT